MSRFRLFGRPRPTPPPNSQAPNSLPPNSQPPNSQPPNSPSPNFRPPAPPGGSPPGWGPPPVGAGAAWPTAGPAAVPAGPATRSARPAPAFPGSGVADPPTDPVGFPPIRPAVAVETPHPAEAAALAGAFAVDYLSWDQDDPERRGRVLLDYLPTPGRDPAHLGWSGRGRQRADFALPGRVSPDGDGRVLVDVRVRVTPYRSVGDHAVESAGEPDTDIVGAPAGAPAPTGRGWRSLAACWIRLSVPVASEGGRLVVDAWEETLGEEPAPPEPAAPTRTTDDHTLADDDPLTEPPAPSHYGGVW